MVWCFVLAYCWRLTLVARQRFDIGDRCCFEILVQQDLEIFEQQWRSGPRGSFESVCLLVRPGCCPLLGDVN